MCGGVWWWRCADVAEMTRRRREAIEKARAEERHWKLTQAVRPAPFLSFSAVLASSALLTTQPHDPQGKTDAAQADLARLTLIKAQREEAAKKRCALVWSVCALTACVAVCAACTARSLIRGCVLRACRAEEKAVADAKKAPGKK